jgi:hypothetical protein
MYFLKVFQVYLSTSKVGKMEMFCVSENVAEIFRLPDTNFWKNFWSPVLKYSVYEEMPHITNFRM